MRRTKPWRAGALKLAHKKIVALGRKWEKRLGLAQWTVSYYVYGGSMAGGAAETRWHDNYQDAGIAIDQKWLDFDTTTDEDIEINLVHELCHLLFAPMDDEMASMFGLESTVYGMYAAKREGMCDVIAKLIVDRYKRKRD